MSCNHICLVPIGTQRIKICVDCGESFKWNLDTDQVSMYGDTNETIQRDFKGQDSNGVIASVNEEEIEDVTTI